MATGAPPEMRRHSCCEALRPIVKADCIADLDSRVPLGSLAAGSVVQGSTCCIIELVVGVQTVVRHSTETFWFLAAVKLLPVT